jgi:insertion element IS1 protein InsB
MAINGSGIRDTARVLQISPSTVIAELKKAPELKAVNESRLSQLESTQTIVRLCQWQDVEAEAEADEMCSFVERKSQKRWLWHAIDHHSGEILAYILEHFEFHLDYLNYNRLCAAILIMKCLV